MEFTFRAILLGIILAVVLAAANAYLGLKVGMTVSASIPAAVLSFAILRWFAKVHIRENNLVQTAASAGESLAAGMIFTLPALILLNAWQQFDYLQGTLLITLGGILGVLIAVPLRHALLNHEDLRFPEGVATARVLQAGAQQSASIRFLVVASLLAAAIKFLQSGLGVIASAWQGVTQVQRGIMGFGIELSPALIAVGYIVGLRVAVLMVGGGLMIWGIAMPVYSNIYPGAVFSISVDTSFSLWSSKLRFIGVGAMLMGGLWVLLVTLKPVWHSLYRVARQATTKDQDDRTFSMRTALIWVLILAVPITIVQYWLVDDVLLAMVGVGFALIASFLFSAVAAYMAGLMGSSNNPISGVTIATIFISAWLVYLISGGRDTFAQDQLAQISAAGLTIFIGATVCCAAAISGDTMQDLKAGQLVGATPRYQTWMQLLGVAAAGIILIPVLELLYQAYGIAGHLPRADMDPAQALAAPQASLMQSVALGVFSQQLEWSLILVGVMVAVIIILLDSYLRYRSAAIRIPVMAVAVGMYLPLSLTVPIFLGGFVHYLQARRHQPMNDSAILFASGLIAGEALVGVLLAIPFAIWQSTTVLRVFDNIASWWLTMVGVIVIVYVCYLLWKSSQEKIK